MANSQSQHELDLTGLALALLRQQQQKHQLQSLQQHEGGISESTQEILFEEGDHSNPFESASTGTSTINTTCVIANTSSIDGEEPNYEAEEKDDDELLINEVRNFRCLWDTKCRGYKDTPKKTQAWKQIAGRLGKSGE